MAAPAQQLRLSLGGLPPPQAARDLRLRVRDLERENAALREQVARLQRRSRTATEDQWGRFREFHETNPGIYRAIEATLLKAARAGKRYASIAGVFEDLRADPPPGLRPKEEWRLNNTWRAIYIRMALKRHPELAGVVQVRKSKFDAYV